MLTPRKPQATYKIIVANETSFNGWENPFSKENPFNENQKFILCLEKNNIFYEESTNEQDLNYYKENYKKYNLIKVGFYMINRNECILYPTWENLQENNYIIVNNDYVDNKNLIKELQQVINRFNDYINNRLYRVYLEETINGKSEIIDSFGALYRDEDLLDFITTTYKDYAPYTIEIKSL